MEIAEDVVVSRAGQPPRESNEPFTWALNDLLRNQPEYRRKSGGVNVAALARAIGEHHENLRKYTSGEVSVLRGDAGIRIMEETARVLGVEPTYFAEYRVHLARQRFDIDEVGFEEVMRNLDQFRD